MIKPGDEPIRGYRVEKMLGRGQYGEVWRATTPGRSTVALKVLDMTGRRGWKEFRAVQRVKQIRHAHLMPIVAIWLIDEDGNVLDDDHLDGLAGKDDTEMLIADTVAEDKPATKMIIATLLADVSLRDRLDACLDEGLEGVPASELIGYMEETAKGIDFLNSIQHAWAGGQVGVQHCDIKPDNVMLVGGSVVICDFGVAQILADAGGSARATSLSGSPAYMAPEAFEAKPSRTSDQYSLAVTYYELRTARLPIAVDTFAAVYDAHRSGKLDFSHVPPREQAVLQKATQLDPNKRYESSTEFVAALRAATQPRIVVSKPPVLLFTLLALLIGGGTVAGLWSAQRYWRNTTRVVVQFGAADLHVTINDQPYTTDSEGLVQVRLPKGAPARIEAADNPDRKDQQWTIEPSQLVEANQFKFAVPYTTGYFVAKAQQLLSAGKVAEAADAFASAIADDSGLSRYPQPTLLTTAGVLWSDCLLVTPGGDRLIVGGRDGVVRSWSIGVDGVAVPFTELHRYKDGSVVSAAANDAIVATVDEKGAIWTHSAEGAKPLADTNSAETRLAVTGDGKTLVATAPVELMTQVFAWDAMAADPASTKRILGQQPGEFPKLVGCRDDGVVVATIDSEALIWQWHSDTGTNSKLGRQADEVFALAASGNGKVVAYAGAAPTSADDTSGGAAIVDIALHVGYRLASTQADSIVACSLDAQGDRLVTSERISQFNDRGAVVVWQPLPGTGTAAMERVLEFPVTIGDVTALVTSYDAGWVAAGHESGAVTLWRNAGNTTPSDQSPLLSVGRGDRIAALRITPDGRWLISGGRDGRLMVFDLWKIEMIRRACEKAGVTPEIAPPRVTFHGPLLPPVDRFLAVDAETVTHREYRPSAGHA